MQSRKILPGLSLVIDMDNNDINNDLISREALKDAIMQEVYKDRVGVFVARRIFKLIDNAPTVETKTIKECILAYGDGYESAKRLYERPQGEWICDYRYLDCKCSICNSYPLERGDYPELSPYCPQCGARMEVRINGSNNNT